MTSGFGITQASKDSVEVNLLRNFIITLQAKEIGQ